MSTRMCKLKLLDLPVEILVEILSQLEHIYILRSSAVRGAPHFYQKNRTPYSNLGLQAAPRPRHLVPRSPIPHRTRLGWVCGRTTGRARLDHRRANGDPDGAARSLASPATRPTHLRSGCGALPRVRARRRAIRQSPGGFWLRATARRLVAAGQRLRGEASHRGRLGRADQGFCA